MAPTLFIKTVHSPGNTEAESEPLDLSPYDSVGEALAAVCRAGIFKSGSGTSRKPGKKPGRRMKKFPVPTVTAEVQSPIDIVDEQPEPSTESVVTTAAPKPISEINRRTNAKIERLDRTRETRLRHCQKAFDMQKVVPGSWLERLLTQSVEQTAAEMLREERNFGKHLPWALGHMERELEKDSKTMQALLKLAGKSFRDETVSTSPRAGRSHYGGGQGQNISFPSSSAPSARIVTVKPKGKTDDAGAKAKEAQRRILEREFEVPTTVHLPAETPVDMGKGIRIAAANDQGPVATRTKRGRTGIDAKGGVAGTKGAKRRSKGKK